ncbi:MAG: ArsR family transcriptional regulator, arsenate/arsenite/antimonite-responsive transcriptional [Microbacteriaceae bacterium]|jgi:ArsR family transcriptional regulator|nr:ArsR family transcriptional regulator [Microbacteriaceae bacterium]MDQ1527677.1 ArsR family transcriptional regulator, arsenate/arsenite/antimonite-responsive transcriptional [Microbacteriaceae bacterium]
MADIFDVVADPTRRDLLQVLLERYTASEVDADVPGAGEISVGEIVEKMALSQPTVSKHLKVLRDHGLVHVREEGQHRYYSLDSAPLEDLEDWLIPFLSADFDDADAAGSTVFAAWSGVQVPAPLRRAAESLQHPGDAGAAIGRVAADASFQAINAIQDASHGMERRVISPIKKKLGRKDG